MKDHGRDVRIAHELYESEAHKVELQSRNVVRQFDEVLRLIERAHGELRLTRRKVLRLHRFAMLGIYDYAGRIRGWPVVIEGSSHRPPEHRFVKGLVADMCATANDNPDWPPTKTAAYILWRLNWIHPLGGGNGRTSRALAYYALCVRLGFVPSGKLTIAEQIDKNRKRYQDALVDADAAWKEGVLDVTLMESLLNDFLELQLAHLNE